MTFRITALFTLFLSLWVPTISAAEDGERPNIIFLLTDDQRDGTIGAMGHPFVQTPHMDKLVDRGVRFTNTYIATPVCAQSRISLFTGLPERVHGVGFSSIYNLSDEQWAQSYPVLVREAGYHTGFIGKFGLLYHSFKAEEAFDFWYGHRGWTRFLPKDHNNADTRPYHQAKNDIITPIMGEAIEAFLESRPEDKPFCLSVSFNVPHGWQSQTMFTGYAGWQKLLRPASENPKLKGHPIYDQLYRDLEISIPEDTATDPYRFIPKALMDQDKGRRNRTYPYNYDWQTCLEHHYRYYQQITGLDVVIGDLLEGLKQRGLDKNTVIIFASDHGLLMGEYGMGGKALLYDLASKIPCFIYDPMLPESHRGREVEELVSSIDITRTILDYAGVEAPSQMSGLSLRPLLVKDQNAAWRDELFLESLFTLRDTPFQEGIRRGPWKYIRMFDGKKHSDANVDFAGRTPDFEQLFNLEDDPGERHNLIETYAGHPLLAELREACAEQSNALNETRRDYSGEFPQETR
ncbi:MAG: sulfatase-like hydrolase/transferase [Opitutales bacterium]